MMNLVNLVKFNQFSKAAVTSRLCKLQLNTISKTYFSTQCRLFAVDMSHLPKKPKSTVETKAKYPRMLMVLPIAMALVATSIFVSKKFFFSKKSEVEPSETFSKINDSEYENKVLAELEARHRRKTES